MGANLVTGFRPPYQMMASAAGALYLEAPPPGQEHRIALRRTQCPLTLQRAGGYRARLLVPGVGIRTPETLCLCALYIQKARGCV